MSRSRLLKAGFGAFVVLLLNLSCAKEFASQAFGAGSRQAALDEYLKLVEQNQGPDKANKRFIANKRIIELYNQAELERNKILYLTFIVERFPEDPYNGYYLADVAQTYEKLAAPLFARHYYEKVVTAYEDLFYKEEYLHRYCLQKLVALSGRPEERIRYSRELLDRFSGSIDVGAVCFGMARAYEEVGEYEQALARYKAFLEAPPTTVPGFPDAYARVREKLVMYEKTPNWIHADLDGLVALIRQAIEKKDVAALNSYRARGYFFTLTWEQKNDASLNVFTELSMTDYIGMFLLHSNVAVESKLDIDSNAREAFLRTDNWAFQIHPTWYFYFRKVDFRPDPEINGGWEWAGVYFGEKL